MLTEARSALTNHNEPPDKSATGATALCLASKVVEIAVRAFLELTTVFIRCKLRYTKLTSVVMRTDNCVKYVGLDSGTRNDSPPTAIVRMHILCLHPLFYQNLSKIAPYTVM